MDFVESAFRSMQEELPMETRYPEHEKLKSIQKESQTCGEFLDWISHEKGLFLAHYHKHGPDCAEGCIDERIHPSLNRVTDLLSGFFEIDQKKLEAEKREMIVECRRVPLAPAQTA